MLSLIFQKRLQVKLQPSRLLYLLVAAKFTLTRRDEGVQELVARVVTYLGIGYTDRSFEVKVCRADKLD